MRFVYLTDTHVGCDTTGYWLQPRYLGLDRVLFEGLSRWLRAHDVAFVVHGGDLTDHGFSDEIARADDLCSLLEVPVYLCLGNHDLMQPDSMEHWRSSGFTARGALRAGGSDCFAVQAGEEATVVVVSHHWHEHVDHRWLADAPQSPRLDACQERTLANLFDNARRPVIAVTHAPLNDVAGHPLGPTLPFHPPCPGYLAAWRRLGASCPSLRLVLCGHNHAHSHSDHGSFVSCTTAAFSEIPAQLRLVSVAEGVIDVRTIALADALGLDGALSADHAWCVGSAADQHVAFSIA